MIRRSTPAKVNEYPSAQGKLAGLLIHSLSLFWIFSFFMKALWFQEWHREIHNQVFGSFISEILFYLLPLAFLATGILLIIPKFQLKGIYLSLSLWLAFSSYILLASVYPVFNRVPCSCAAIIPGFSWQEQLLFNSAGLLLSLLCILFHPIERRVARH